MSITSGIDDAIDNDGDEPLLVDVALTILQEMLAFDAYRSNAPVIEDVIEYLEYVNETAIHYDDASRLLNKADRLLHDTAPVRAWRALKSVAESFDIPLESDLIFENHPGNDEERLRALNGWDTTAWNEAIAAVGA